MKRKELERLARQHFRQESTHVQEEYISKAAPQPSAAAARTSPQPSAAAARTSPPRVASEIEFRSSGVTRDWKPLTGKRGQLHKTLLVQFPVLRSFFGDAGALETLAAATRILSVVAFQKSSELDELKLAVVTGMAAKLTQTAPDILKLWAKVGGRNSKQAVLKLEREVMFVWSRAGLDPDVFV
jgi:hypothetical protein